MGEAAAVVVGLDGPLLVGVAHGAGVATMTTCPQVITEHTADSRVLLMMVMMAEARRRAVSNISFMLVVVLLLAAEGMFV